MIKECPASYLCKVVNVINLPNNEVFVGEIVETYVNADCVTNGNPDVNKINPLILAGGAYRELGNKVGNAFSDGKMMIKK